jgi:hypothetical protein
LHSKIHNSRTRGREAAVLRAKHYSFLLAIWEKYAFFEMTVETGLKTGLNESGQKSEVAVEAEA